MTRFHLAQVNIAMPREPVESPLLADFVAALDPINQIADTSPGFVWRLQTEAGNATSLRWPTNDGTLVNMSVWESVEALSDFVYRSAHVDVMKQRRKWFETMQLYMVLWWVPRGHIPTLEEAHERLQHLREHGPTRHAFNFRQPFAAPDTGRELAPRDQDRCPSP